MTSAELFILVIYKKLIKEQYGHLYHSYNHLNSQTAPGFRYENICSGAHNHYGGYVHVLTEGAISLL